jgi:hypothetical protein
MAPDFPAAGVIAVAAQIDGITVAHIALRVQGFGTAEG